MCSDMQATSSCCTILLYIFLIHHSSSGLCNSMCSTVRVDALLTVFNSLAMDWGLWMIFIIPLRSLWKALTIDSSTHDTSQALIAPFRLTFTALMKSRTCWFMSSKPDSCHMLLKHSPGKNPLASVFQYILLSRSSIASIMYKIPKTWINSSYMNSFLCPFSLANRVIFNLCCGWMIFVFQHFLIVV